MEKLKIEYMSKTELVPYANNAKIHTDEQVEQIRESIAEFGFNDPIAIWQDNMVIEGHGRLLAVMGMDDITEVPVVRLDGLTDEERKAYALVHNKLTMNTGFDFEALQNELNAITDIDMSAFGFISDEQISDNIDDFFEPDEVESKPKPKRFKIKKPHDQRYNQLVGFLVDNSIKYEER